MFKNILFIFSILISFATLGNEDLGFSVLGTETEDLLSNSKSDGVSPYLSEEKSLLENSSSLEKSPLVPADVPDLISNTKLGNEFKDTGFTVPGTFENQENYTEIDKDSFTQKMKSQTTSAFTFYWISDHFDYQSPNDVIARTITKGYKHVQSGFIMFRSDRYLFRNSFANFHWSFGSGLAINYARGIFVTGEQSSAQFRLYEIPVDLGIGFEIPITRMFKISGTVGPSVLTLIQNRSDFTQHETGKNKAQFGFGEFASLQFKTNLLGFGGESSYDLFTSNQISNLYFNLEFRFHNYDHYLENIKISGSSLGAGVTFEFL